MDVWQSLYELGVQNQQRFMEEQQRMDEAFRTGVPVLDVIKGTTNGDDQPTSGEPADKPT